MSKILNQRPANVIDYQPEWSDEFGYMSNALEWAQKNVLNDNYFYGVRYPEAGGMETFQIGRLRGQLTITLFIGTKIISCTSTEMFVTDKRSNTKLEIYKPFRDPTDIEKVVWKCELKTAAVRYSNIAACPVHYNDYLVALTQLVHSPWAESQYQKTHIDFIRLATGKLKPANFKHLVTTEEDVKFYDATHRRMSSVMLSPIPVLSESSVDWRYRAVSMLLLTAVQLFKRWSADDNGVPLSEGQFYNAFHELLDEEWRRLATANHYLDAIDVYRYLYKVPYANARESVCTLMGLTDELDEKDPRFLI